MFQLQQSMFSPFIEQLYGDIQAVLSNSVAMTVRETNTSLIHFIWTNFIYIYCNHHYFTYSNWNNKIKMRNYRINITQFFYELKKNLNFFLA